MQPFLLSPKERVRHWREHRLSYNKNQPDLEQIVKTYKYWQQFPLINHFLDVDDPKNWPTSWELIMGGNLCSACLAYLMEQTLSMSDIRWTEDRLNLMYVDNKSKSTLLMVLVIDNKYVVNYSHDSIINFDIIEKNCIIQQTYRMKDKRHFIT